VRGILGTVPQNHQT